jgi:predicted nucleic acid-binding protein
LELANALAMSERKGRITPARTSQFIALIDGLPILIDERTPNIALSSVLELSRRERLSTYDASYLELAMRRGVPLATKDDDLARPADRVGVTLLLNA